MDEASISIEETNKIRLQLGLKPIPIPNQSKSELDVDQTNKIRLSLGLKPLETEIKLGQTTEEYQKDAEIQLKNEQVKENLDNLKQRLIRKKKINIIKTLAESDTEETDDWLSKISNNEEKKNNSSKKKKINTERLKVNHNLNEFNGMDKDVILTLKDQSIFNDDDELESNELLKKKKLEKDLNFKKGNNEIEDVEMEDSTDGHFMINGKKIQLEEKPKNEPDIKSNKIKINLELELDEEEKRSDYSSKPIKIKKIKKQSSLKRQKNFEIKNVELINQDLNIRDNLELQSMLNLRRINTLKKRRKLNPEELVEQINNEKDEEIEIDNSKNLIIDENDEFLSSIKNIAEESKVLEESEQIKPDFIEQIEINNVVNENTNEDNSEINFTGGLASTLNFLKSKNVVKDKSVAELNKERQIQNIKNQTSLNRIKNQINKRINPKQEVETSDLNNYKPEINLKYIDEFGREMNQKEAYKQLSHQFHGKIPNKNKIEKKRKKLENELNSMKNEKLL